MHEHIDEILFSREVIDERVKELAAQILAIYREESFTMAVVLNGAFIFAADLIRHLAEEVDVVFVRVNTYGEGTSPQVPARVRFPDEAQWHGRHVLIVEDIVDTGHSINALRKALLEAGAASVRTCAFLDKPVRREVPLEVDFLGFTVEGSPFLVGYGLDLAGRYRNLPYIGTLVGGSAEG